jgi:hypothetical protein
MCNAWNHPPECRCGWGGDGHLGGSPQMAGVQYSVGTFRWAHRHLDVCRPSTCLSCGKDVFFVRHNGGMVWFDELGWPWPKHGCFVQDRYSAQLRRVMEQIRQKGIQPDLGVILEAETSRVGPLGRILVRRTDGSRVTLQYPNNVDFTTLPGQLVVLGFENGIIVPTLVVLGELRPFVYLQIIENATNRVVDEFSFPRKVEAEQSLRALELQCPGQYRLAPIKRLE